MDAFCDFRWHLDNIGKTTRHGCKSVGRGWTRWPRKSMFDKYVSKHFVGASVAKAQNNITNIVCHVCCRYVVTRFGSSVGCVSL